MTNYYKQAGINDLVEFYRTKFVSDEVLDQRYFKALDRFDMRFARTMWVYDNVRTGSSVLDLGCGARYARVVEAKGRHSDWSRPIERVRARCKAKWVRQRLQFISETTPFSRCHL